MTGEHLSDLSAIAIHYGENVTTHEIQTLVYIYPRRLCAASLYD